MISSSSPPSRLTDLQILILGILLLELDNYAESHFVCRIARTKYKITAPSLTASYNMFQRLLKRRLVIKDKKNFYRVSNDVKQLFQNTPNIWREAKDNLITKYNTVPHLVVPMAPETKYELMMLAKKANLKPEVFAGELILQQLERSR